VDEVSCAASPLEITVPLANFSTSLAAASRIHIPGFLARESADMLWRELARDTRWTTVQWGRSGRHELSEQMYLALTPEQMQQFAASAYDGAHAEFRYLFEQRTVAHEFVGRASDQSLLARFADLLNTEALLTQVRQMTGISTLCMADVRATCYRAGHFLTRHADKDPFGKRRLAYVLSLTPQWRAEWGGQLQFLDDQGHVIETHLPCFNVLTLFLVPQLHAVSVVAPFAPTGRYSVTGWFLDP
jgi:SM-20-related protein